MAFYRPVETIGMTRMMIGMVEIMKMITTMMIMMVIIMMVTLMIVRILFAVMMKLVIIMMIMKSINSHSDHCDNDNGSYHFYNLMLMIFII